MSCSRFNAEDVRHKALLKATADTYGGTLPLPRRARTNGPISASTPNGDATLPRQQRRHHVHTPPSFSCIVTPSSLEISCRRLYEDRMKTCKQLANQNTSDEIKQNNCSPLDSTVNKLRSEMINLIDQDLSLLQRLLTLNERIDDLKCHSTPYGCDCYSQQHTDDECSDVESRDTYSGKYPSPSTLSLFQEDNVKRHLDQSSISGSMCSGLDVIIDITTDSDYEEGLLPEQLPTKCEDEGYATEQRPELKKTTMH